VISPAVTCKKISHFVSADSFVGRRRVLGSVMDSSSQLDRGDNQPWVISRWTLRGEVRRKPSVEEANIADRNLPAGELAVLPNTGHEITPAAVDTTLDFLLRHAAS